MKLYVSKQIHHLFIVSAAAVLTANPVQADRLVGADRQLAERAFAAAASMRHGF